VSDPKDAAALAALGDVAMSGITTQVDGPVLRIVLDRPDKLNAVNTSMLRALKTAMDTANDDSVRVVVLTGAGRAFCAGGDLTGVDTDGAVIAAPPEWLDRLLGVLLDNACKYAPQGGRVAVTVAVDGSRVALTVDDSGPGGGIAGCSPVVPVECVARHRQRVEPLHSVLL